MQSFTLVKSLNADAGLSLLFNFILTFAAKSYPLILLSLRARIRYEQKKPIDVSAHIHEVLKTHSAQLYRIKGVNILGSSMDDKRRSFFLVNHRNR